MTCLGRFAVWAVLWFSVHPFRMKRVSRGGAHKGKRFLVIRRQGFGCGLFSFVFTHLGWMAWARRNDYIPVIDMRSYRTIYHRKGERGKVNVWDLFFEQPAGYSLEDIERAHDVTIVNSFAVPPGERNFRPDIGDSENVESFIGLGEWRTVAREMVRPRPSALDRFRSPELEEALQHGVLGVLARGTDYLALRPKGHPVQPSVGQLLEATESYLRDGHRDERIFLVTEDAAIANAFVERFGDRVILSKQQFVDYSGGYLYESGEIVGNVARGAAYLKAIVDLSRCKALIAGRTSGTMGAVLLSKGFDFTKVFALGTYA